MNRVALISIGSAIITLLLAGLVVCPAKAQQSEPSAKATEISAELDNEEEVEIDLDEEEAQVDLAQFEPPIHKHHPSLALFVLLAWIGMVPAVGWRRGAHKDVKKNK